MPEPIEFQVVKNLQAVLAAIAVSAGYHYDVQATAVKLDPDQAVEELVAPDGPRPFIVLEAKTHEEVWDYSEMPDQVHLLLPATVHWIGAAQSNDDDSRMQTFFRGCADVEQAITVDSTRGGLAVDTRITKRTMDTVVEGTQVWALIDLEINIRRTLGQPNG